jgi:hypothetical protein
VRQGAIEEAVLLETGAPADPALWFTIEQLYDDIPLWSKSDGVDDVSVEYDPVLGFPSRIEVGYEEGIFDAGSIYTVTNVGPA